MKFAQARLSPPGFGQILGEAAVDLPADYFKKPKAEYQLRRDTIVRRLNKIPVFFVQIQVAHFMRWHLCLLMMRIFFVNGLLESFNYNGATLMLAPATGFYGTEGLG